MKKYSVVITIDAEDDLVDIYRYVLLNDTREKADRLLDNIEKVISRLTALPLRGSYPPELERSAVYDYREVFFKPYRIIYQISGAEVYVHCVLDGRRDMPSLLHQRLLRP